ncbi:MAG: zf-HC2 domain-containing protein [Candidatus Dormibacteria bacterium]
MTGPDPCRENLGAHALGALDAAEAAAVEGHLRECPGCRHELSDLAAVGLLVARAGTRDKESRGRERLGLGQAGRWRWWGWPKRRRLEAGALTLMLVGGVTVALLLPRGGGQTVAFEATSGWVHASGTVTYHSESWGTQMVIQMSGLPPSLRCQVWVESAAGGWQQAGAWTGAQGRQTVVETASGLPLRQIAGVALEAPDGRELLWAAAPQTP